MKETKIDTEIHASDDEKMALKGFETEVIELCKKEFLEDGELLPMMYIGSKMSDKELALEGEGVSKGIMYAGAPVNVFMQNSDTKEILSKFMHEVARDCDPVCICMSIEAWYTQGSAQDEEELLKVRPGDSPHRREALIFTFESENILRTFRYDIKRDNGLSIVDVSIDKGKLDGSTGRFSGMLKDMKKAKNN